MKPGHKLDALITEKVLAWRWFETRGTRVLAPTSEQADRVQLGPHKFPVSTALAYSTERAAAELLMMEMIDRGFSCATGYNVGFPWEGWRAWFGKEDGKPDWTRGDSGDSEPHAVCLAALKALGAL